MRSANLAVIVTIVLCLTAITIGQSPQKDQPQPARQLDPGFEAAHDRLFTAQDKAGDASRLTQAVDSALPGNAASSASIPRKNFIDEFIFGRIEREGTPHSPLADDEEFLRRAYVDAIGLLPTVDQARSFLSDTDPNKRDKLIDSLIGSEQFTDQWAYYWGELLRARGSSFQSWMKQWLKVDRPYNEVFADIVTVAGKTGGALPQAGAFDALNYIANRCGTWTDPDNYAGLNRLDWVDQMTVNFGQVFLGIDMDCFSCHNGAGHADTFNMFLGSKKRTDFWKQAAFFGNLRLIGQPSYLGSARQTGNLMDDLARGYNTGKDPNYFTMAEGRYPRDGRTYEPEFILTGEKPKPGENPRKALGRILPTHIQFARAAVNLIWSKLMVVGFVDSYDGFDLNRLDPQNPPPKPWTLQPTNPELLNAMAEDFRGHNFSVQRLIKMIMKSNAYRLSTKFEGEWKDTYIPYYPRRFVRVLTGPEAADLLAEATEDPYSLRFFDETRSYVKELSVPANVGARGEGPSIFTLMQAFYQGDRNDVSVNVNRATPVQAMMMMGSPLVTKRIAAKGETRVAHLLKSGKTDDQMIEELFLSSLVRRPTTDEIAVAKRLIAADKESGLEELQWTLLNSAEFLVNH